MANGNQFELDSSTIRNYFESKCPDVRWKDGQGTARCLFHDDHRPSLSIDAKRGLFFCHACRATGNLVDFERRISGCELKTAKKRIANLANRGGGSELRKRRIVAQYTYADEQGEPLFQLVRFDDPKSFAFRELTENGNWAWGLKYARRVLYHLPEVLKAELVFVVEGEKDVETLRALGLVATCNPGGAGKWIDDYSKVLAGKRIVIIPDADPPGKAHAQAVAEFVARYATEVKLLPPFQDAKDVTEWFEKGGTEKQLLKLVAETRSFDSGAESVTVGQPEVTPVPLLRGPNLVRKLELFFQKRVILPVGLAFVLALWVIGTHMYELFDCYPYLCILSPTKRCGKTLLAELIGLVSARAKSTVNISEAALFRMIQIFRPTIIMDEAEILGNQRSERAQFLLSLLNAGHRRNASVIRCSGPNHTPVDFPVFCPKVVIAIGELPDTLRDRSVTVAMRRRRKDEEVLRYRYREVSEKGSRRAALTSTWAEAHRGEVAEEYAKTLVEFLEDREADNWAPLFSIAASACPDRLGELKETAIRLGKAKSDLDVDESYGIRLLSDLRLIFTSRNLRRISTNQLIDRLKALEEGPWEDMTPSKLARTLRPFGISSKQLWMTDRNVRGYEHDDLKPVFDSYLSSVTR